MATTKTKREFKKGGGDGENVFSEDSVVGKICTGKITIEKVVF